MDHDLKLDGSSDLLPHHKIVTGPRKGDAAA